MLKPHIDRLFAARETPRTICSSEGARVLKPAELQAAVTDSWRELMPENRSIVGEMRTEGEVEVLQKGEVLRVDLVGVWGILRA